MAYSGRYIPKFPEKYKGDPTQVWYRSLWERQCMTFFDTQSAVKSWSSEELILPYRDPITQRPRRYFPDFVVTIEAKDKKLKVLLIEVKPLAQTKPPIPPKSGKQTPRFIRECYNYGVNQAKWDTARAYCRSKGWKFVVWTEADLPFI